jgi:hypothetical protein
MKRRVILFWVIFLSLASSIPARDIGKELTSKGIHVASLSGEDKINLQINRLEQAIRQQNAEVILGIVAPDYSESDPVFDKDRLRDILERCFSTLSNQRGFSTQVNQKTGWRLTASHDFYLLNPKIRTGQDKAQAECDVGFFVASNRVTKDTLTFSEMGSNWLLTESKGFFSFLESASAKMSDGGRFASVLSDSPVLSLTEKDFVSTNSLRPTLLYSYAGYVIPRMSMSMCQQLWGFTDGFITPYGVLADIEICQGGSDFNHEYLFITDFMANNIVASDQDNWLVDFGEWGSGVGQFKGPYGLCTIEGYYYFVADMFNNRVICYVYYNQLDEPQFHSEFDLGAGGIFNHPRDVEAKERRPGDLQGKNYIAVADMNNHRIVLSYWWPYFQWALNYGAYGSGQGQFMWPTSVCFGREADSAWQTNDLYVTDYGNRRLVRLHISPETVVSWGNSYDDFPIGAELTSVEVDNRGLVYVVDRHHAKVYKLAPSSNPLGNFTLLGVWGEKGAEDGQLYNPNVLQVAHGRYVPYPDPWVPLTGLGDVFVTESWGDQTGVRRFVIAADIVNLAAYWVPYNESTGEGNFIWWEYDLTDFGTVTEQVLRGGEVCTTYNEGTLNWGSQAGSWPVDGHPHAAYYTVKVTASSTYDPTIVVEKTVDVYVDTVAIHNPVITQGIRCKHDDPLPWCNDGDECIQEYKLYTIDVQAYDPDGGPLTYEWNCAQGYFFDGTATYKDITTLENYVCYHAPPPALKDDIYEKISVSITNPVGGQAGISLNPGPYLYPSGTSCLGGDANDDGVVNVGDVIAIQQYLYGGGEIPDPIERADASNDCIIDMGDMVYLIAYLYRGGPAPKCCWLHEWNP